VLPYGWLDPWVARRPFEGRTATRYAHAERPAFGDLDERLLARLAPELATARQVLDVGAGNHELAALVAARCRHAAVIAIEPSLSYTRASRPGVTTLRAVAEELPLETASVDLAVCMSSLRHVRDRLAALTELRRVVRPGGATLVVELDPRADTERAERHRGALRSSVARWTFDPFLLRSGPTADQLARIARVAGWSDVTHDDDALQPVYVLRLS
jgi:ubiquinone/menaquinone biosynthesis C-methylase UbiE